MHPQSKFDYDYCMVSKVLRWVKFLSFSRGSAIFIDHALRDHRTLSSDLAKLPMICKAWSMRSPCSCLSIASWRFCCTRWYFQPPRLRLLASLMRFCLGAAKGMKTYHPHDVNCELHLNYAYFKSISNKMRFGK